MTSIWLYLLRHVVLLPVVTATMWLMTACGGDDGADGPTGADVTWMEQQPVLATAGTATLEIAKTTPAGMRWRAEVLDASASWISFVMLPTVEHTAEGVFSTSLADRLVRLYYAANNHAESRSVVIRFTFENQSPIDLQFVQPGQNSPVPSPVVGWSLPELPARIEDKGYQYVTHYCTLQGERRRNYTLCYDAEKRAAHWVAYPMHSIYLGSGRVENWEYDPQIAKADQPQLYRGYTNGTTWNRGHQIPNADRNATSEMQDQTFYFSNMTPQNGSLNQQGWMRLEAKVRDWKCSDTLYVVTGAYWAHTNSTTKDNAGTLCPIPTHYYKVLARTVKGNVRTKGDRLGDHKASELMTIGFWVENKSGQGEAAEWVKSVAEIERLTGFEFFPTLPDAVKEEKNPARWGL